MSDRGRGLYDLGSGSGAAKRGGEVLPLVNVVNRKKSPSPGGFFRTTSCVSDPQVSAMEALQEANLQLLSDLINEPGTDLDVNKAYPEEKHKTLLHVAIEQGNYDAVRILLAAGAKTDLANRLTQSAPIHVAARKGNEAILKALLAVKTDVNALTADGKNVLHILAKKANEQWEEGFLRCLNLVLQDRRGCTKVEIDKKDQSGEQTPLYVAVRAETTNRMRYFEVIRLFLAHGADWSLKCNADKTIREIIQENVNPYAMEMLNQVVDAVGPGGGTSIGSAIRNELMQLINEAELRDNWDEFRRALDLAQPGDLKDAAPGETSLLQRAAEIGLPRVVKALLDRNVDPNFAASGTAPPLILAAKNGHFEVIMVMKEHKLANKGKRGKLTTNFAVIDDRTKASVLHAILRKPYSDGLSLAVSKEEMEARYTRCLEAILKRDGKNPKFNKEDNSRFEKEIRLVINSLDEMGNTPLHYATQMWPQEIVRLLLEMGANIGMKNAYGEIPVENILPETMESFLDEFCLTSEGDVTNKDFRMTARYDFLAPPLEALEVAVQQPEIGFTKRREGWSPRNGLVDPESSSTKKLVKPINDEDNTGDIDLDADNRLPLPETEVLWHMSQSKKHRHLLKHPVITSFLWMKWKRIAAAYLKNLLFYSAFVICLTTYIFCLYGGKSLRTVSVLREECGSKNANWVPDEDDGIVEKLPLEVTVLWWINAILLIILAFREFVQFGIAPRRYFFSWENWLEVTLIVLTSVLLFHGGFGCHVTTKRHLAAVVIVLSWSELITMVGRHPKLSTYNIYVTMFYTVTSTFILFLIWYSLFIFAFALGFYILLHKDDGHEPDDNEYGFFNSFGLSIVKTFTMFVGELEFGELPIDTGFGYLFLLAFIFLIVVVMMNLLNGLAVSDTGVIRAEAEINYYSCQVEVISYIESMLLGDPFNFLSNWPTFIWLRRFPSCSLGRSLYRVPPLRSLFHKVTGGSGILLFYEYLPDKRVAFYPNHEYPFCGCVGAARDSDGQKEYDFHPSIMEAAKGVALAKVAARDSVEERLAKAEDLLHGLKEENAGLNDKLDRITALLASMQK